MGFPRYGAFVGIAALALLASPSIDADGTAAERILGPAEVALVIPTVKLTAHVATRPATPEPATPEPATPSCVIDQGQDGQVDFQIAVPPAGGGRSGSVSGRCSARSSERVPARARYRAVPFAPESIGGPGSLCPTFSPDGKMAVFVRNGAGLVESRRVQDGWTEPAPLPFSGPASRDGDPFLSPDGSRLYFWSTRTTSDGGSPTGSSDIWVVDRRADGWGAPRRVGPPVSDAGGEPFPAVAADGTLYFGSTRPGGRGGVDLYRARPNATGYSTPENLGIAINTQAVELDGYVSPDQDVLVFASDRPGGYGKLDLYVSHRMVGGWSPARNLGRAVNGPDDEFCPQITPDGRLLVFSTARGVFQIDAAVLDDATP
jgi:hypothetical protein